MNFPLSPIGRALFCVLGTLALAACGDDEGGGGNGGSGNSSTGGGTTGGGGSGGSGTVVACIDDTVDTTGCAYAISPTADDTTTVQTAFIEAQSGSDICLCPGTFAFDKELSLTVPDVTVRGLGATREDTVLDFATQTSGDDGVTVTSDGFTVENLWIKNSPGNGIVVTGAEDVTFRNLKVSWDAGSVTENGAYAVYPVKSTRVLVEDTEVVGAADAGIYVGQCEQAIVRNNVVYGNVAGIEFENTLDAEAYGNEAYDNSAGLLVFVLPNLEKKVGARTLIHDNNFHDNNRENFAVPGSVVAAVPAGTGVLLLGSDDVEIRDNDIVNNISTGIVAVSYTTFELLVGEPANDPMTDPWLENTFIIGNTFTGNGTDPQDPLDLLGVATLEDVLFDGQEEMPGDAQLCLGDMAPFPSFRNFNGIAGLGQPMTHSTDTAPHECTLTPLSTVDF